jgi:hypothetical protein
LVLHTTQQCLAASRVSRAQRSTKWCAADPGPLRSVAVTACDGPGSAMHRSTSLRAASHPGHPSLGRVRSLIHFSNSPSRSRGVFSAPGACNFASLTRIEGWAERRETFGCSAEHPWGLHITRQARRLRGALRPMTRDARLSALHRGGFGLPGPRFRLLGRPPSYNGGQLPCGSVQRAPRTQVVVPGGRGPYLPGRAVTSRRRRTPHLAPHSGSSLEHALNERG